MASHMIPSRPQRHAKSVALHKISTAHQRTTSRVASPNIIQDYGGEGNGAADSASHHARSSRHEMAVGSRPTTHPALTIIIMSTPFSPPDQTRTRSSCPKWFHALFQPDISIKEWNHLGCGSYPPGGLNDREVSEPSGVGKPVVS